MPLDRPSRVTARRLADHADIAVHSAKDLPSATTEGLCIAAFVARRDPRDALIGSTLDGLALGATVATGSVRRRAQLRSLRPDLRFAELRGNIHSRLDKVPDNGAIVMAVAALQVLGLTERITEAIDTDVMVPAVGQGCVAIECRLGDGATTEVLRSIDDDNTRRAVVVERAFLAELGSGCSLPIGAHVHNGLLHAFLANEKHRCMQSTAELGRDPIAVAQSLARQMHASLVP